MLEFVADPATGEAGGDLDIEAAIAALPPGARRVLVLAGLYGYCTKKQRRCSVSRSARKAQLHRARQLLAHGLHPRSSRHET